MKRAIILSARHGLSVALLLALAATGSLSCGGSGGTGGTGTADATPDLVELDLRDALNANGELPQLEDPITPDETAAIAGAFSWADTEALPELDDAGRPALYYALVYITSYEQESTLDAIGIVYNSLPLFEEERARWDGQRGEFAFAGDGHGVFVFAMLPGELYNALRDVAQAGEPLFEVISLREAPTSILRTGVGSLSYDSLAEVGFDYQPRTASPSDAAAATGALTQKGFFRALRRIIRAGQRVVEAVRQGFGEVQRFFNGDRFMTFRLFVHNTDPAFGGASEIMRRAWGSGIGEPLWLKNVEVQVSQRASLTIGHTDDFGMLAMAINRDHTPHVCIVTRNHAAEVGNAWIASKICNFDDTGSVMTRDWVHVNFRVSANKVNLLAQASDGYDFAHDVLGYRPHKARILVSPWANLLGGLAGGGRPFTLCGGLNSGFDPATSGPGTLGRGLFELGSLLYAESDVVFPTGFIQSRGVMSHEYGHFLMCSMFARSRRISFSDAWSQVVNYSVRSLGTPGVGDQTLYMIEGFADFIAAQLVGGVNYFGLAPGSGTATAQLYYCDPDVTTPPCLEDNVGGPTQAVHPSTFASPYKQRVAFVTTLLHDAFDGQTMLGDVPSEGDAWGPDPSVSGNLSPVPHARTSFAPRDETISLPGTAVFEFLENWADFDTRIRERPLLNALAETAFAHGYSANEVCSLFGLHAPIGDCTTLLSPDVLSSTDVPPSAPVALTCSVTTAVDGSLSAPCTWTDISTYGTGFDLLASDDLSYREAATAPYARTQTHEFVGLPFDARVMVHVATMNGAETSSEATALVNTPPEPVLVPVGDPLRGGAEIRWPRVRATEYVVRMHDARGVITEVARTHDTATRILGLEAGMPYEFDLTSVGRTGLTTTPSASVSVTPVEPGVVYVSARLGDDLSPTAGFPTSPFRTLGAAVSNALASDAQIVRVEAGSYAETAAIHVTSGALVIEGGYRYDGASTWTPGATPSDVALPLTPVSGSCTAGPLASHGARDSAVGLWVDHAASLFLKNLSLHVDAGPAGVACVSAVRADAASMTLEGVQLTVDVAPAAGSCALALQFLGTGTEDLLVRGSDLGVADVGTRAGVDLAGACVQGATSVSVTDSTLTGLRSSAGLALAPASASGLAADDASSLRVSRSSLTAVSGADTLVSSRGELFGLWARASASVFVDNSVVRTPSGGDINHALDLGSGASPLGAVRLYYVTAAAGSDWSLTSALPTAADATALTVSGDIDELHVVNSLLSFAAGASVDGGHIAVMDVSRLSPEPGVIEHRGEALSFPWFVARWGSFQDCRTGEFFTLRTEATLNAPGLRRCDFITVGADRAFGNIGFWNPPGISDTTPLTAGGATTIESTPADTRGAMLRADGHTVGATDSGAPFAGTTPSLARLRSGGVVLDATDPIAQVSHDRGGAERAASSKGVGAWIE